MLTVVMTNWLQLTEDWGDTLFGALKKAGGHAYSNMAVGYNNVDVDAATRHGIAVGNTPVRETFHLKASFSPLKLVHSEAFVSLQMALKQFAFRAFVSLQIVSEALLPKQMTLKQFAFRSFLSLQIGPEALSSCKGHCIQKLCLNANGIETIYIQKLCFSANSFRSFVLLQMALKQFCIQKLYFNGNGIATICSQKLCFTAILLHSSKGSVFAFNFVGCAHRDNSRACSSSHPFRSSKGCGSR